MAMSLETEIGEKVIFTCDGGHDYQKTEAQQLLTIGEVYEVVGLEIENWSSEVLLKGFKQGFNTCLFENWNGQYDKSFGFGEGI